MDIGRHKQIKIFNETRCRHYRKTNEYSQLSANNQNRLFTDIIYTLRNIFKGAFFLER